MRLNDFRLKAKNYIGLKPTEEQPKMKESLTENTESQRKIARYFERKYQAMAIHSESRLSNLLSDFPSSSFVQKWTTSRPTRSASTKTSQKFALANEGGQKIGQIFLCDSVSSVRKSEILTRPSKLHVAGSFRSACGNEGFNYPTQAYEN
jgi:hypothetical protein